MQERDHCLVAVSGDGTISITDLRKMKVAADLSLMRLMYVPECAASAINLRLQNSADYVRGSFILQMHKFCPVTQMPS